MSNQNHKIIVKAPNGEDVVFWAPFEKQIQFHESNVTNLLARGSRGSGKSELLRNDAHMRAMSVPNCNLVLIRNTLKQLNQSHLINIRKEMQQLGGYYHGTNYVANYPTGSKLFFSYIGHESDALNLLGAEILAAYFDEISTIPWDHFIKLSSSIRVKRGAGLKAVTRSATNPFGESAAEVEKYFVNKDVDPEEDENYDAAEWDYLQINMEDNPYIDLEQYKKRLVNLPLHLQKAWLQGVYSDEEALFNFSPTKNGKPHHVIEELDIPWLVKHAQIFRAFDWGWHPDPSYCLWIAHLGNRYIAFHEKIWYRTIVPDIAEQIKEEDSRLGINKVVETYCDPTLGQHSGSEYRTNIEIFEACGIPITPSVNDRALYASVIHTALTEEASNDTPKLQIYRGNSFTGCPYLVRAMPLMRADPKKPMLLANHKHDHPCVTLAYYLISHDSWDRRPLLSRVMPKWMRPVKSTNNRFILGDESVRQNRY